MRLTYQSRMIQPWRFPERYDEVCNWLQRFNHDEARLDKAYGISYINGVTYINDLSFKDETDLLAFNLKFPEFLHSNL